MKDFGIRYDTTNADCDFQHKTLNGIGKEREMTLKIIITYMRYLNM